MQNLPAIFPALFSHPIDEVKRMESGFYALFMKTGEPRFYLLAKRAERYRRENGEISEPPSPTATAAQ